ncbi:MAG: ABC transporter permease [Tissierellales bacterium]
MIQTYKAKLHDKNQLFQLLGPVFSIIIAFIVAGLVVWATGGDPIEAYTVLAKGAFGSLSGIKNTIRYTIPIIMLGISFAICSKCGYFNIGQEGQMYAAAIAVAAVQRIFGDLPMVPLMFIMIIAAILAGGIICIIPAIFKFLFNVNEVITAMLINYIILLFTNYLLLYSPIAEVGKSTAMSIRISPVISGSLLLIVSIIIILVYGLIMKRTTPGYRLKIVGYNQRFAKASGINTIRLILIVAFLGGAFSGISVAGEMFGVYHKVYNGFVENLGFYGMTAALIGSKSTLGLVLGALILGSLQSGAVTLSVMTDVPSELVLVVQGFVMLFATINIMQYFTKTLDKKGVE